MVDYMKKFGGVVLGTLEFRDLEWLWYPYLSYGNLHMIFGPGGHGKSFLSAALAASVSMGGKLPGMDGTIAPANVLMLTAEDSAEYVMGPRLAEMEADLDRIMIVDSPFEFTPQGLKQLRGLIEQTKAKLVTIDPIVSFLGGKIDMNKMNEVRAVLGTLQTIAKELHVCIVIFHHARKSVKNDDSAAFDRAAGSADFTNAVRSSLMVAQANDGENYVMKHVKSNYGPRGLSLGYTFGDNPVFKWGEFYSHGGEPLGRKPKEAKKRDACWEFVSGMLMLGPQIAPDVLALASQAGFDRQMVYRAVRGRVNSVYTHDYKGHAVAQWSLIEEPKPEAPKKDFDPPKQQAASSKPGKKAAQTLDGFPPVPEDEDKKLAVVKAMARLNAKHT